MPKRHRQPEPIDVGSAGRPLGCRERRTDVSPSSGVNARNSASCGDRSADTVCADTVIAERGVAVYSPGDSALTLETRKRDKDLSATPEFLEGHHRRRKARARLCRIPLDKDGQAIDDGVSTGRTAQSGKNRPAVVVPHALLFSPLPDSTSSPVSEDFDPVSHYDDEDDEDIDLSSNSDVGDDGNQPSTCESAHSCGSDNDSAAEEEAQLHQLRRAIAAAAGQQRRINGDGKGSRKARDDGSHSGGGRDPHEDDGSLDSDDADSMQSSNIEEDESDSDMSGFGRELDDDTESEEDEEDDTGRRLRATRRRGGAVGLGGSEGDDDEDDDDDDSGDGLVTVDFGVFDMEASNVDGLLHLMDQLCPDKMNEVDRDELGLALYESPYTSVVRLQNNGEDTAGEEEQEFYGLCSLLDVAHGQVLYPHALRPLCELLQRQVWRQAASGIPPVDILTSVVEGTQVASSRAKCLLLVSEYIRNIPLELTVQILQDLLDRVDTASQQEGKQNVAQTSKEAMATHAHPIFVTHPSMFAVLAKVQRATDAPVTLLKNSVLPVPEGGADETGNAMGAAPTASRRKRNDRRGVINKKNDEGTGGSGSSGGMCAQECHLDLTHYIFWREEDGILYEFRDKRVASLVYRCRPQYDGQPEHELPLSIFFVLQYGAVRQAVGEMRRRQTIKTAVERY